MMSSVRLAGRPAGVARQLRGRADEHRDVGRAHERRRRSKCRRCTPARSKTSVGQLPRRSRRVRSHTLYDLARPSALGEREIGVDDVVDVQIVAHDVVAEREARRRAGARCAAHARDERRKQILARRGPTPGVVEASRADDAQPVARKICSADDLLRRLATRAYVRHRPLLGGLVAAASPTASCGPYCIAAADDEHHRIHDARAHAARDRRRAGAPRRAC